MSGIVTNGISPGQPVGSDWGNANNQQHRLNRVAHGTGVVGFQTSGGTVLSTRRPRNPKGWNGNVVFANLRGVVVTVSGTSGPYLQIFRDTGTANFYSGAVPVPWPEGQEFWAISDLSDGAHKVY